MKVIKNEDIKNNMRVFTISLDFDSNSSTFIIKLTFVFKLF